MLRMARRVSGRDTAGMRRRRGEHGRVAWGLPFFKSREAGLRCRARREYLEWRGWDGKLAFRWGVTGGSRGKGGALPDLLMPPDLHQ